MTEVLRQQRGGERRRRDAQQHEPVEQQERVVHAPDQVEDVVVAGPHDQD